MEFLIFNVAYKNLSAAVVSFLVSFLQNMVITFILGNWYIDSTYLNYFCFAFLFAEFLILLISHLEFHVVIQ